MTSFQVTPMAGLFPQIACHGPPRKSAPPRRAACVQSCIPSRSGSLQMNFLPSHNVRAFGAWHLPRTKPRVVPVFSSRLLPAFSGRDFVTTTESSATLHRFVRPWVSSWVSLSADCADDTRLPQLLRTPRVLLHPHSRHGSDQESGFALSCTLTHPWSRIRFACAVCSSLPIASFRPCRYRQRPCDSDCLPPGRGDACFFQQAGFARYAGQTKKAPAGI